MKTLTLPTVLAALVAVGLAGCGSKKTPAAASTTPPPTAYSPPASDTEPKSAESGQELATTTPSPVSLGQLIYFEFDSSILSEEARQTLAQNAEWLKQDPARRLTIEGHTDEVGTTEYNVALGERRARAALEYLLRLGIEPGRVDVLSFGEERPASADDAENRRAVFVATRK